MPTLLVQVSGHGFGHWGQTVPVLRELHARVARLRIVVRSALDPAAVRSRFPQVDEVLSCDSDRGLAMRSTVDVSVADSHDRYVEELGDWERGVAEDCRALDAVRPDAVLSNVGYRVLAAAARLGVPALALSSLNWADVYLAYAHGLPGAGRVYARLLECYRGAAGFVRVTPGIAMPQLDNIIDVGPVAAQVPTADVRGALGLAPDTTLLAAALGGIPTIIDTRHWPTPAGAHWLCPPGFDGRMPGRLGWPEGRRFEEVVGACDAVVTKVGYGSLLEAASRGVRILYAGRPGWPEDTPFADWLA
ncbi:MAG: hypothetical protein WD928_15235, partial [Gammaproteobacteria bacterium]